MIKRRCSIAASFATFAGVAVSTTGLGCTSSDKNGPSPQEAGVDASEASEASMADGVAREANAEAGRTITFTWRVVLALPLTTEAPDGGEASEAGVADADAGSLNDTGARSAADAGSEAAPDGSYGADAGDGGAQHLAGVEVCVYQHSAIPCVMTDAEGIFTLPGLAAASELAVTFRKDGYLPVLVPVETPNTDMNGISSGIPPLQVPRLGSSPPLLPVSVDWTNKGQVVVAAILLGPSGKPGDFSGDIGAKVSLSAMNANGPYFLDQGGAVVPSATSMLSAGAGFFFNLDPGSYEVTFHDPNHTCSPLSAFFGAYGYPVPPTSVKFPVLPGYETAAIAVYCTAKSIVVSTGDAN